MAGYVAVAVLGASEIRIDRPGEGLAPMGRSVARTPGGRSPGGPLAGGAMAGWVADGSPTPFEDLAVVRSFSSEQLRERLAAARRIWAQSTFYLFDPESWR